MKVVILDYQAGNTHSVALALRRLGQEARLSADPEEILKADKVILPGVGAARSAMQELQKTGLDTLIPTLQQPVLGICLGMQLFCRHSEEGDTPCLQLLDTPVRAFPVGLGKVPLTGWNSLDTVGSPLLKDIPAGTFFYFVHSYYVPEGAYTTATATFGASSPGLVYTAALQQDNFFAVQFHPERSGPWGARLLRNFLAL